MAVSQTSLLSNISLTDRNTDIPFFPNISYNLTNDDFGVIDPINMPAFQWIQAFFDDTLDARPQLCVFTGAYDTLGAPILSQVTFAYSGHMIQIKGMGIFSFGKNWRGQSITSTPIGSTASTNLLLVTVYGGQR